MKILTPKKIVGLHATEMPLGLTGQLYAMIDHGGMPGLVHQLDRTNTEWVSLFAGSRDEGALDVAPLLFLVDREETFQGKALLSWICAHGAYSTSVILMESPLLLHPLAFRLAKRLDATLADETEIFLRFFDTRIFEVLLPILSLRQKKAFLDVAYAWWYVNRRGEIVEVEARYADTESELLPLALSDAQETTLLEACELDQVAALLVIFVPNEYNAIEPFARHEFISRNALIAQDFGIKSVQELAFFCSLALLYGEDFIALDGWTAALDEVSKGKSTLGEVAARLEEVNELKA